ncbi:MULTISPECIES: hypothetical protein [Pseudomonas]|uniref:hypothetical protein n=1 Tax=Pseudomonas TaxID=286 RepID=UPI001CF07F2C|nr:hypothetical protein [Pseudomonas sp. HS-18]UCL88715.1 hypothetical protein LDJ84_08470 [Pseudomonas sp. HS-18]
MLPEKLTINLRPRSLLKWVLLSPLVIPLGWWVWTWPWGSEKASGWAQAVGSVLAIVATYFVATREQAAVRLRVEIDEANAARLAECAVHEACSAVRGLMLTLAKVTPASAVSTARLRMSSETLQGLLQRPLPARAVNPAFVVLGEVAEALNDVERWVAVEFDNDWKDVMRCRAEIIAACRLAIELEHVESAKRAGIPSTRRIVQ